jgi:hypothetical protein
MPEIIETEDGHYLIERKPYESYEFFLERVRQMRKGAIDPLRKAIDAYFRDTRR